jgi:LAS superfamily LD-carboxypeptidase LdcB
MGKRLIISESEKNSIRKMYGLIIEQVETTPTGNTSVTTTQTNPSIEKYVKSPNTKKVLYELQQELINHWKKENIIDEKGNSADITPFLKYFEFQDEHFENEKKWSGVEVINDPGGILPEVEKAFTEMTQECPKLKIVTNGGYRTIQEQKNQLFQACSNYTGFLFPGSSPDNHRNVITEGQRQAAIPGFGQHQQGRALDLSGYESYTDDVFRKYGFIRPFLEPGEGRNVEEWHFYYVGDKELKNMLFRK